MFLSNETLQPGKADPLTSDLAPARPAPFHTLSVSAELPNMGEHCEDLVVKTR